MKMTVVYTSLLILFSCSDRTVLPTEGMFTRMSAGEYSRSYDTLFVYKGDTRNNSCVVHRKIGYSRIVEGKEQPRQFKSETMLTICDPSTGQLTDIKTGRVILFRKNELLFGTAVYKKE